MRDGQFCELPVLLLTPVRLSFIDPDLESAFADATFQLTFWFFRTSGAAEPRRHLFLAAAGKAATLIVTKSPLAPTALRALEDTAKANEFTVLLSPDTAAPSAVLETIGPDPFSAANLSGSREEHGHVEFWIKCFLHLVRRFPILAYVAFRNEKRLVELTSYASSRHPPGGPETAPTVRHGKTLAQAKVFSFSAMRPWASFRQARLNLVAIPRQADTPKTASCATCNGLVSHAYPEFPNRPKQAKSPV